MNVRSFLLSTFVICLLSSSLSAQRSLVESRLDHESLRATSIVMNEHELVRWPETRMNTGVQGMMTVDATAMVSLERAAHAVVHGFPVDASTAATVTLTRVRPVADGRTIVVLGSDRGDRRIALPSVVCFRGAIDGEPRSRVFLALIRDEMVGFVEHGDGVRWIIGPANAAATRDVETDTAADDASMLRPHTIVSEATFPHELRDLISNCAAERTPGYHYGLKAPAGAASSDSALLELRVAVEADNEYYRRTGGTPERAVGYTIALFSMVSSIFEDEVGVTIHLPWIKVWATQDPYQVAGNGYALWGKVPAYWKQNYDTVERDIAHVMTASDWGGGGIGFRGEGIDGGSPAICSREYGYSMTSPRGVLNYPTFAFTYDVYIVAHELGHNFGARHTHDCWWGPALDTCLTKDDSTFGMGDACYSRPIVPLPSSGSIMSYCMGINQKSNGGTFEAWKVDLDFTPRVAAVMRREIDMVACRHTPPQPEVILTSPRGRMRLRGDTTIDITWRSIGISQLDLEYSLDSGATWRAIADAVPVQPETYRWHVPLMCSRSVLVRISDRTDSTLADTSLIAFDVESVAPKPTITQTGDTLIASLAERYQWTRDDGEIPGATERTHVARRSGDYVVRVETDLRCSAVSDAVHVSVAGVGDVEDRGAALELSVSSMPDGSCGIRVRAPRTQRATITLVDGLGRVLRTVHEGVIGTAPLDVLTPADGLPTGVYYVVLRSGCSVVVRKWLFAGK